ncbi:MAG TPA: beta-ketoacyl-[acyl-carrier-protein] synthase II [Clostridiales bacterium]|nr:beta-ketoacyl-[acyl-carrier-protein] synthase II [Clostridiales bacterium]
MEKRRVLITGLGTINPLGHNTADTWKAVRAGQCGIAPITHYDASAQKVHLAAEVKDWDPTCVLDKKEARHMSRYIQLAVATAKETLADSGLDMERTDPTRCGVIISSGVGGIALTESEQTKCLEKGFDRANPYYIPVSIANMGAGYVAIHAGFQGMCTCPVTACAGGSNAVGDAFRYIRDGYAEVMLCGGSEAAITPLSMGGFTTMRALHVGDDPQRASIPFDAQRSGFVMGEGAAVLMLEEYEHAMARGAKVYAEVVGYGVTCDAYHITAPAPDGAGGARAMAQALADAGDVKPEQVGYINAHGTSTPLNDKGETTAIKTVFGAHAYKLAVSSTKSMTGHMLGAAGAIEALVCALALKEGYLPATINYQQPDPDCDLDYIPNQGREAQVEYALSNSLGFGGHNACLLFKRWEG